MRFEQARHGVVGEAILVPAGRQLMDHPDPDPAALAAADVKRLLAQAPHLRRIVEVAEAVAGGKDAGATGREPEPPGDDQHPVGDDERT